MNGRRKHRPHTAKMIGEVLLDRILVLLPATTQLGTVLDVNIGNESMNALTCDAENLGYVTLTSDPP